MSVLVIDKPVGPTSFDVVKRVQRLLRRHREAGGDSPDPRRIGHGGTLDPLASGVLPVCVGQGTKVAAFLLDADKQYDAIIQLGAATDTLDAEGQITHRAPVPALDEALIRETLARFTGPIVQTPPMYSALKKDGRPLYEYARLGQDVEREPRRVTIHELELREGPPGQMGVRVRCSKGTYIRVLAVDIAQALGTVGHLADLRRVSSGPFRLEQALTLDDLARRVESPAPLPFLSPADALAHLPALSPPGELLADVVLGRRLPWEALGAATPTQGPLRLLDHTGALIAVVARREDGRLEVRRVWRR